MGLDGDKMAVLDSNLRVRGVNGLRVADTSIMPLLNQGHTQMPAYAIGEKAADLIKGAKISISLKLEEGMHAMSVSGTESPRV